MITTPTESSTNARAPLILLFLFRVCRSIAAGMITIAFPYFVLNDYGFSSLTLGFLFTSAAIATAVIGLLTGILADIWGRRSTLIVMAFTLPLSALLVYLGHGLPWLYAGAILGGYSATGSLMSGGVGGAVQPIQTAIIASIVRSSRRTLLFSVFGFSTGLFAALGVLAAKLVSTRTTFLVAFIISLIGALLVLPLSVPEVKGRVRQLKGAKVIGKFSLTGMLNGFAQGLVTPFLIPFFFLAYGVPKEAMAHYGFASGAIASIALLGAPLLDRKLGFVWAITLTRGIGAALVAVLPLFHALKIAVIIYLLFPALRVIALPAQQRALTDVVDVDETGRALGINQVLRLASSSVAVALTGYFFSKQDFATPFYLYAGIMAVNIVLYFRFFGHAREQFARKG